MAEQLQNYDELFKLRAFVRRLTNECANHCICCETSDGLVSCVLCGFYACDEHRNDEEPFCDYCDYLYVMYEEKKEKDGGDEELMKLRTLMKKRIIKWKRTICTSCNRCGDITKNAFMCDECDALDDEYDDDNLQSAINLAIKDFENGVVDPGMFETGYAKSMFDVMLKKLKKE